MPPDRISLGDLPGYLAEHNLRMVEARWPADGEPELVVSPLPPSAGTCEAGNGALVVPDQQTTGEKPKQAPAPRKPSKLTGTLAALLHRAYQHRDCGMEHTLPGGLRIVVKVQQDGQVRLLLAREGVYPADKEWASTVAHWPYDVPDVSIERFEHEGWRCLRSAWQAPDLTS